MVDALFESSNRDVKKRHHSQLIAHASEMHEKIWPGIAVPQPEPIGEVEGKKGQQLWMPTSLMLACVVQCTVHTKRSPQYRLKGYRVLRTVVEQVCSLSDTVLEVMHVHVQGGGVQASWHNCQPNGPCHQLCCNQNFMQQYLEASWIVDLNSAKCPWVTSPSQTPHFADWISFCLDMPASSRHKQLMECKRLLEPGVLSLVSQMAYFLSAAASRVGEDLSGTASKKFQRLSAFMLWTKTGLAAKLLHTGEDGVFQQFVDWLFACSDRSDGGHLL